MKGCILDTAQGQQDNCINHNKNGKNNKNATPNKTEKPKKKIDKRKINKIKILKKLRSDRRKTSYWSLIELLHHYNYQNRKIN